MPRYFFDSSALAKRYHQESGTAAVDAMFADPQNQFFVSRLALVEVTSSFARRVREGIFTPADFVTCVQRVEGDVSAGFLRLAAVSSQRLQAASGLFAVHGLALPLRTLDAIHMATAEALFNRTRLTAFVAADQRLLAVAVACGLPVIDVS